MAEAVYEPFAGIVRDAAVVVCTGTGGVGKTTTAAAIALHGARHGRHAVVVTIDPARRLADALGVADLGNEPHELAGAGRDGGSMHALMLDTRATFDGLVARYAKDREQVDRILANRFYQNIAGTLSGTDEFMAMEKLHDIHESARFDLIVVDTPPTRNALAFLDAPRLISRLLDNRLYRVLVSPTRGIARTATSAAHLIARQLTRVVGSDVVDDAIAFFRAFDGMERGFERRANSMLELLRAPTTAFVLVASPRADTIGEARHFAEQLDGAGIAVRAVIANRMTPTFGTATPPDGSSPHATALRDFRALAEREEVHIAELATATPDALVVRVPILPSDVHDLAGLTTIAELLMDGAG
jgi:anion-transporting  ArsA/GET3 family ATPase